KELTDTSNGYKYKYIDNKYNFKTPQFGIVTTGNPEKEFLDRLTTNTEVVKNIDSFIKSDDMNFYSIDYSWQKGSHYKNGQFNPDWFIKQGDNIIVVEIKDDSQISDPDAENIGKNKAATKHFELVNEYSLTNDNPIRYKFTFLTPKDFDIFFKKLTEKDVMNYKSQLDVKLAEVSG
ncbi:MAG: restriction endonuclease subunit R, partial [Streptococcus hyovaginalis]|nr:restriction endonuclease subunit R [Streptococcus hyovaginalis]